MSEAKQIRKHTAQHDLFNRLHSISADHAFVKTVAEEWYKKRFAVVPNQRCGNWYCDPESSSSVHAYFKSTDGHTNNWSFNLRRSNLPLAKWAEEHGGLILVDSTRRGKRMPDGLSKTVPIWCAVINIAVDMRRRRDKSQAEETSDWDTSLYLPPNIVSASERSQIESKLHGWAEALEPQTSSLPPPDLQAPLRPFFVHPSTSVPPHIAESPSYTPIICLSASRWVGTGGDEIPRSTRLSGKTVGYEYVAGAGDDDELWARGLKPVMYHAHRTELLSADRDDLPDLVDSIVEKYRGDVGSLNMAGLSLGQSAPTPGPSRLPYIGVPRSTSRMALDIGRPVIDCPEWSPEGQSTITLYIGEVEKPLSGRGSRWIYNLGKSKNCDKLVALPNPKVDPKPYDSAMRSVGQLAEALSPGTNLLLRPARQADLAHFLAPLTHEGKDAPDFIPSTSTTPLPLSELIAARKVIIPAALVILCSNASLREASSIEAGDGSGGEESEESDDKDELVDKALIASQLHSLVSLWPDGNPPRAALRRVNESLMSIQR